MQLARRGGLSGLPIILPEKVDGYVQSIRDKNVSSGNSLLPSQGGEPTRSYVNAGSDIPRGVIQEAVGDDTVEKVMGVVSYAGFSAGEPISEPTQPETVSPSVPKKCTDGFDPLKLCIDHVVDFPEVLGIAPGDFQLFDCTEAEEPLRILLNPSDDWVYPVMSTSYPASFPRVMTEFENEAEVFWNALKVPVPSRLIPFIRFSMNKQGSYDIWTSFIEAFDTLVELGSCRDHDEARNFLDILGISRAKELVVGAIIQLFSINPWSLMTVQPRI